MVTSVTTVAFVGVEAVPVDVQVQIASGLPSFSIVGLADKAVGESRERVRSAILAAGLSLPAKRITVNLAPADLPKAGSHYDLPIALGLMVGLGALPQDALDGFVVLGELGLDGGIASVSGILPAAMAAVGMHKGVICPKACGAEAAWAGEALDIVAAPDLLSLANHLAGRQLLDRPVASRLEDETVLPDLADVRGQPLARRALEIAAAGGHNLLMVGPPGAGKSMLAARLPSILPPLSPQELLEVSTIHSVAGVLANGRLSDRRPFRAPHHSASMAALVGGGLKVQPGEVSLSHHGVLFLDELPEFSPQVLDSLRQPLENGVTVIARANQRVSYPSHFQLIAAMNPCKCGQAGTPGHTCRRGDRCAADYQARLSGPFLDRIDLKIEVPAVSASDLMRQQACEPSAPVAKRVTTARSRQLERIQNQGLTQRFGFTNAALSSTQIEKLVKPDSDTLQLLEKAAQSFQLSARAYHRVLKVALTIADLENVGKVQKHHVAEALGYRVSFGS